MPAAMAALAPAEPLTRHALAAIGLASALGEFFMTYSIVCAGVHLPVWVSGCPK